MNLVLKDTIGLTIALGMLSAFGTGYVYLKNDSEDSILAAVDMTCKAHGQAASLDFGDPASENWGSWHPNWVCADLRKNNAPNKG